MEEQKIDLYTEWLERVFMLIPDFYWDESKGVWIVKATDIEQRRRLIKSAIQEDYKNKTIKIENIKLHS